MKEQVSTSEFKLPCFPLDQANKMDTFFLIYTFVLAYTVLMDLIVFITPSFRNMTIKTK